MYKLRAICPPALTADLAAALEAQDGVDRVTHRETGSPASHRDLLETEVSGDAVESAMETLAADPRFDGVDIYLRPIEDTEHYRIEGGRTLALDDDDEGLGISVGSRAFRRLVRVDYQYVLLMVAASVVATAGMVGGLPVVVVGAMAFSPDLGRLNAMAFALISRQWRLLVRGAGSLAVGMTVAVGTAAAVTLLLSLGTLTDPLGAIPDLLVNYVTVVDGVTITVAIGSGVAAMVVFITDRGTAAVGVGVSITTIPAAAYAGIAFADGNWTSAGDALIVLGVNVLCVIVAGVATGLMLRRHLKRRAQELRGQRIPAPRSTF